MITTRTLREAKSTAKNHAEADHACGRAWSCACGACRIARAAGFKPKLGKDPLAQRMTTEEYMAFVRAGYVDPGKGKA